MFAQHITVCKAYTEFGTPIDIIYSQNIAVNQTVCILLNAGNKNISEKTITIFIDLNSNGVKQNQFSRSYQIEKGKNWFASNFKFGKEGVYDIYFTDEKKTRLGFIALIVGSPQQTKNELPVASTKYLNSEILFCSNVQSNTPVNIFQNVSLKLSGGSIYIFIRNNEPFFTETIRAVITRRNDPASEYNESISSKKYQIERDWTNAYFKNKFDKTGDYKISVFDENELLIKTAYITVTN